MQCKNVNAESSDRTTLHLKLLSLRQHRGIFDFRDHLERTADFDDWLVVDIGAQDSDLVAWAIWNSQLPLPLRDYTATGEPLRDEDAAPGCWANGSHYHRQHARSSASTRPCGSRSETGRAGAEGLSARTEPSG